MLRLVFGYYVLENLVERGADVDLAGTQVRRSVVQNKLVAVESLFEVFFVDLAFVPHPLNLDFTNSAVGFHGKVGLRQIHAIGRFLSHIDALLDSLT